MPQFALDLFTDVTLFQFSHPNKNLKLTVPFIMPNLVNMPPLMRIRYSKEMYASWGGQEFPGTWIHVFVRICNRFLWRLWNFAHLVNSVWWIDLWKCLFFSVYMKDTKKLLILRDIPVTGCMWQRKLINDCILTDQEFLLFETFRLSEAINSQ